MIKLEFLKNWALVISGTIIFAALCEILIPKGTEKKYIKLLLGMVLTLALIKPLEKISVLGNQYNMFDFEKSLAYDTNKSFSADESKYVTKLYTENLEGNIKMRLESKLEASAEVFAEVSEEEKSFGEIKSIFVSIYQKDGFKDFKEEVFEILKEDFGIEKDRVTLKFTNLPKSENDKTKDG